MNRMASSAPRFTTGQPYVVTSRTPPPIPRPDSVRSFYSTYPEGGVTCVPRSESALPPSGTSLAWNDIKVQAPWNSKQDIEIAGSDFSSSSVTEPFDDDRSTFSEVNEPPPPLNSLGTFAFAHEKALAARERFMRLHPLPPAVDVKLNPLASEFVPVSFAPPSISSNHSDSQSARLPSWFSAFQQAVCDPSGGPEKRISDAKKLARSFPWNLQHISELAQHFFWAASSWYGNIDTVHLALLVLQVYEELRNLHGAELADEFMWRLRECCVRTYTAVWDMKECSTALSFQTADATYIRSALSLTAFIGDLFYFRLLCASQTNSCLRVLLRNTISMDHLTALWQLIKHAGKRLWYTHPSEATNVGSSFERLSVEAASLAMAGLKDDIWRQVAKMGRAAPNDPRQISRTDGGLRLATEAEYLALLQNIWALLGQWAMYP